jgi:sec-independent protein translocase protein TatC
MADEPGTERPDELDEEEGGPVKSFLEHLEDLRWVLIKTLVALGVAVLVCLLAGNRVVEILKWPLSRAKITFAGTNQVVSVFFGTNRLGVYHLTDRDQKSFDLGTNRFVAVRLAPIQVGTNQLLALQIDPDEQHALSPLRAEVPLVNFGPVGGFYVAFQVALYGGLVLASPFIFYFVAAFVFPALKMREKHYVYRGLGFGVSLFMIGVLFCYFFLMPVALAASQKYSSWLGFAVFQWKAEEYISFVCRFMLGMGLGFEMPVVILTLVKIGVLNYRLLSKGRRYMIVINLILGAVLTTPEVITQVIMFIPLQMLYEVSIWVAWYWERRDRGRGTADAAATAGSVT